jgi:hypothetical protein
MEGWPLDTGLAALGPARGERMQGTCSSSGDLRRCRCAAQDERTSEAETEAEAGAEAETETEAEAEAEKEAEAETARRWLARGALVTGAGIE